MALHCCNKSSFNLRYHITLYELLVTFFIQVSIWKISYKYLPLPKFLKQS